MSKNKTVRPQKNDLTFPKASVKQLEQNLLGFEAESAMNECSLKSYWLLLLFSSNMSFVKMRNSGIECSFIDYRDYFMFYTFFLKHYFSNKNFFVIRSHFLVAM